MADTDEKARAEKLAAAKKRVAQIQKQKGKKGKKGESSKQTATSPEAGEKAPSPESKPEPEPEQQPEAEPPKDTTIEKDDTEEAVTEIPVFAEEPTDESNKKEEGEESMPKVRTHGRQPSISVQSKLRSSSFRQDSKVPGISPSSSGVKSPPLFLSPDGSTAPEMFRKQAIRLEELEKENRRLKKEVEITSAKWKKSEEQLDDLREASTETVELKERLVKAEKQAEEVEKLKAEISALQRQNSHLHTRSHRPSNSVAVSGNAESPASELLSQLDAKSTTIENMEMEISNLRAQLNSQSTHSSAHEEQISALEDKLSRSESALEKSQRELADAKQAISRAAEKAVKEGVDKTSTETLIKSLERQIKESEEAKAEADKRADLLEKKLQALSNLHKESESRHQTRLKERDKFEKDVAMLTKKIATTENENLRLKEERDRLRKREASGIGADEGLDELEDEERLRLERKVRDLEGEIFDLRRGIWKERKRELSSHNDGESAQADKSSAGTFDDVDLTGGAPGGHSYTGRRRSITQRSQQHSSFATVLQSGLAAFTGTQEQDRGYKGFDYGSHTDPNEDFLDDDAFDEDAFARAQEEEEAKKRVEWAREIKAKLKDWKGWRLDLVECRYGAQGAGVGLGEIFEA